jgi:lipopolysaccharide export system permease protein
VIYANYVNEKKGILKDVFIYDERSQKVPVTIIAQEGQILSPKDLSLSSTVLRLFKGSIHRTGDGVYTKIQFDNYDISLTPTLGVNDMEDSPKTMTIIEVFKEFMRDDLPKKRYYRVATEFHKRLALPFACIIFSLIGVGLGTVVNRRMAKSGGFVVSIGLIFTYWSLYLTMETISINGSISPSIGMWLPNFIFLITAIYSLRLIWNK